MVVIFGLTFRYWIDGMLKLFALDIETTGLNPHVDKLHGVGVVGGDISHYYRAKELPWIQQLLANPEVHIVGHNVRFDLKFLIKAGCKINCKVWDTKVLAQLIDENQALGLKDLTPKYLGASHLAQKSEIDREVANYKVKHVGDLCRIGLADPTDPLNDLIAEYCLEDCENTLELFQVLTKEIKRISKAMVDFGFKKTPLSYYMEEAMPTEAVLTDMELRGIALNVTELQDYKAQLVAESFGYFVDMNRIAEHQIKGVENGLYEDACKKRKSKAGKANVQKGSVRYKTAFNWQSSDHISSLIFDGFKVPRDSVEKTATGKSSTSEAALSQVFESSIEGSPIKELLGIYASWKKNLKLLTTYTGENKGLLSQVRDGRIYASYLQAGRGKEGTKGGTVTGRLSSREPNMQNLPRNSPIKSCFKPDPGHVFIYFDYSQLELRLAAHLSQDAMLLQAYQKGLDLHQITADGIGKPRQVGKTVNFAIIYDVSPWRLSAILGEPVEACKEIISNTFQLYSGYAEFLRKQARFMSEHALTVSAEGRVRRLPALKTEPFRSRHWKHAIKQGYNFPIQSLGASITKRAMIELHKQGFDLVTQVHDSVVIQVEKSSKLLDNYSRIQEIAEGIMTLSVPLKVDMKILTSLLETDTITLEAVTSSVTNKEIGPKQGLIKGGP